MAKARIDHFVEAQILEAIGIDYVDESEVLTLDDDENHINKNNFWIPFVCGCRNLGEALRRICNGATMIRTKGEAGTGNIIEVVRHVRSVMGDFRVLMNMDDDEVFTFAKKIAASYDLVMHTKQLGRLPMVHFAAGGVVTPANAALMMQLGCDGVFVRSGVFKSGDPARRARAIVQAVTHYSDPAVLAEISCGLGEAIVGLNLDKNVYRLRDEVRNLPCTYKCRHDAAADLIHIYAFTKFFFRIREYKAVTSPPVFISPLDLGPKYSDKLGSGFHEYRKTYGENYCLGQLIFWHNQTNAEPDCSLANASKGCLSLPDIGSFYAKVQKPSKQRIYGPRTLKFMLSRMVKQPQRVWPKDRIWSFENSPKIFGSPMLDAVLHNASLDKELVHWLKHRPPIFHATWDR